MEFLRILNYPNGFEIGARHITVSTCGIVPKIKEFANFDLQVNLAISLHAPNNTIRNQMMKINKQYPLEQVIEAVKEYIEKVTRNSRSKGQNPSRNSGAYRAWIISHIHVAALHSP